MKGTVSPTTNYLQGAGFTMVSNLIMDNQVSLGITNEEFAFIVKIYKNVKGYKIHDSALDPTVSTRTLQRRRKSLKDKGILNYVVYKRRDDAGHIITDGIGYDLSPLEEKLQAIFDSNNEVKAHKLENIQKKYIVEEDDSPLSQYMSDWKDTYGSEYSMSSFEMDAYKKLNDKGKETLRYIFKLIESTGEFGTIIPRLSLFFKVPARMRQLYAFMEECKETERQEEEDKSRVETDRKVSEICSGLVESVHEKYGDIPFDKLAKLNRAYDGFAREYLNGRYTEEEFMEYIRRCSERILKEER